MLVTLCGGGLCLCMLPRSPLLLLLLPSMSARSVAVSVTGAERDWLLGPMEFTMTAPGVAAAVARVVAVLAGR